MSALVSLLGGGVLDRFPRLRVGFLEANFSWAPWLVHRIHARETQRKILWDNCARLYGLAPTPGAGG